MATYRNTSAKRLFFSGRIEIPTDSFGSRCWFPLNTSIEPGGTVELSAQQAEPFGDRLTVVEHDVAPTGRR
jgi:hypothetical protein